jgi:hypothetical protein
MAEDSGEVLLDSMVRVTWDPDGEAQILVDFGDPMWSPVLIDGKQMVDVAQGLNRKGVLNIPRQNETHKLTFTLAGLTAGPVEAFERRLEQSIAAPRDMADVLISFESGKSYRLKDCAVESWPSGQVERLTKETLNILGGELGDSEDIVIPVVADLTLQAETDLRNAGGTIGPTTEKAATWASTTGNLVAAQATTGSQPQAIRPTSSNGSGVGIGIPTGGLYLPGIPGNYVSATPMVDFQAGAIFSVLWDGALPSYTPAAKTCLVSKWTAAGNQRSYALFVNTDGTIELQVSTDGTAAGTNSYTSTVPTALPGGRFVGIVAQHGDTGITFWLMPGGFVGWNAGGVPLLLLGAGVSTPTPGIPYNSTAPLIIGGTDSGTANLMTGYTRTVAFLKDRLNTSTPPLAFPAYIIAFGTQATGTTSVPTALGGGPANLTVNRTGAVPARIVKGSRATFDGTDDSMAIGTALSANAVTGLTLVWRGLINRVSGLNDLIFVGTADGTQPRALLRVDGGDLKALVRRLDAEATTTITFAAGLTQYANKTLGVSVDYVTGLAALYVDGALVATGALTSSGLSQAANSGATRLMAGAGSANPAAGDVCRIAAYQKPLDIFEMNAVHAAFLAYETANG